MGTDTGNGKVVQVIGPVVDIEFPPGKLPFIFNALTITQGAGEQNGESSVQLTMEVAQHLGENRVRAVAMSSPKLFLAPCDLFEGFSASDNIHQFFGNGRLPGFVIKQRHFLNQFTGIACRAVHGSHACGLFGRSRFQ